jgi:hypothetical protein
MDPYLGWMNGLWMVKGTHSHVTAESNHGQVRYLGAMHVSTISIVQPYSKIYVLLLLSPCLITQL